MGIFTSGTLVYTQKGLLPIEEIQIGDKVWSYDEETGEQQWNEVTYLIQRSQDYDLVILTLESGEVLKTTNEHPFYVKEQGWRDAEALVVGTLLSLREGNIEVTSIIREQRTVGVYNITVSNSHTYYVGIDGVLVHNTDECSQLVRQLAASVPKNYCVLNNCDKFAESLKEKLVANKIKGRILEINVGDKNVYSDALGVVGDGKHYAVQVGDTVFENLRSKGIPYDEWYKDFGGLDGFLHPPHAKLTPTDF